MTRRAPIDEVRKRRIAVQLRLVAQVLEHLDDAIGSRVRKWSEKDRVDDAEDRRVRADPHGERCNDEGGESRSVPQQSERGAEVLSEDVHQRGWLP